jgi:hypothetical protein
MLRLKVGYLTVSSLRETKPYEKAVNGGLRYFLRELALKPIE